MTRFVGRARELAVLEQGYRARGGSFVPIYGRRRVGKTELIRQFMAKKRGALYVAGQRLPAKLQLRELLTVAADALSEPLLAKLEPGTWKDALLAIEGAWKGRSKLILALDEFQCMAESAPDLPATLQHLWDTRWRDSGRVMLILCGSFVGFMEREVLGKKAPLFGRRTAQIQLRPFGYAEAALFHPRYSTADRARAYFICGGIPLYHQLFDARRSIEMNIESCFLDEYAPLYREAEFLLREEPSPASVEAELAARARDIPNPGNCTVVQRVFARTVPKSRRDRRDGVRWCSLDDLYDAGREGVI